MFSLMYKQVMFYIVDIKNPPPLYFSSLNSIFKFCCKSTITKKKAQVAFRVHNVLVPP